MTKDNGGPAFPSDELSMHSDEYRHINQQHSGMTLRDYFAAKASEDDIQQFMPHRSGLQGVAITKHLAVSRQQARYKHADAMLLERTK